MTELTPAQRKEHHYNYNYRVAPYDTLEGRANAPQWLKDELATLCAPPDARPDELAHGV